MAEPVCQGSHRAPQPRAIALVRRFLNDASGATAIEYAMIGGFIFAVAAGSIRLYGSRVSGVYSQIGSAITQAN